MDNPTTVDVFVWSKTMRAALVSRDEDSEDDAEWIAFSLIQEDPKTFMSGDPARITIPEWKAIEMGLV